MAKKGKWYDQPVGNYVPSRLFSHDGAKPKANYMLTAKGKIKAEEVNVSGSKGEVIMALDASESPSTISELSNATRIPPQRVKQVIQVLVRDGWVRKTGADESA